MLLHGELKEQSSTLLRVQLGTSRSLHRYKINASASSKYPFILLVRYAVWTTMVADQLLIYKGMRKRNQFMRAKITVKLKLNWQGIPLTTPVFMSYMTSVQGIWKVKNTCRRYCQGLIEWKPCFVTGYYFHMLIRPWGP